MDILKLKGTDKKLYDLVAPLVMDMEVLKQNNGYPFKTSEAHTWYLAIDKKQVVGFLPFVYKGKDRIYIDNYYIKSDETKVLDTLLDAVTDAYYPDKEVTALVHKRHVNIFEENHFVSIKKWKNYDTMSYEPIMETEL